MKISYRTHGPIKQLETGHFDFLVEREDLEEIKKMRIAETWRYHHADFSKNIRIITEPFAEALNLSVGKIHQSDLIDLHHEGSGSFLYKRSDGILETYCYRFSIENKLFSYLLLYYFQGNQLVAHANQGGVKYVCKSVLTDDLVIDERIDMQIAYFMDYYLFTKYSEVQTHYLAPNQRVKGINCKYVNDTSSNIKILDSTWFTNLVKSDAFKVRGHFRLQPKKKDGEWTKEIIWINPFHKEGYTRKAGILSTTA